MKIRLHLKIFVFIAIFIVTKQVKIYGILMLFAFLHEIGHLLTGLILGFKPKTLDFLPFGLSIEFEGKVENYNRKIGKGSILTLKKIIVELNGPITNFIFALVGMLQNIFTGIDKELIVYSNILIGIFNLIPIYPLDGGRILKDILQIFCGYKNANNYINKISYITIILLTAISSILILYLKNIAIVLILIYLWFLVIKENRKYNNKRKIYERLKNMRYSDDKKISHT